MKTREIKFRAWDGREMHDGDRVVFRNSPQVTSDISVFSINDFFRNLVKKGWSFMQYTGEVDKNGRQIYEGDILRLDFTNSQLKSRTGQVVFDLAEDSDGWAQELVMGWLVETGDDGGTNGWPRTYFSLVDEIARCECIGNIYENPDLLTN